MAPAAAPRQTLRLRTENQTATSPTARGAASSGTRSGSSAALRTATASATRTNNTAQAASAPLARRLPSVPTSRLRRAYVSVTLVDDTSPPSRPATA